MKTTFGRTFVACTAILLVALLLVGVSFYLLARMHLTNQAVDRLKNDCDTIVQVATAYNTENGFFSKDFFANLFVATKISGADAVICDGSGKLLLCSDAPMGCKHQGLMIASTAYLERVKSQDHVISNGVIEGLYEDPRYVVATAFRNESTGRILGVIIMSTPMSATQQVLKKLMDTYLSVSVLVVIVALLVMTIYTRKNSKPLRDMAKTAMAFGHGDLKARAQVPEGSAEEMQELALAFNNMARSLEKSEYRRKEFIANVSHELKTPMTTIGGYVDGILDGTIPQESQDRYLQIVSSETKRLSRLVRSMLDISQLQEQERVPEETKLRFDITECVGQVLITFEGKINAKGLQVDVQMPEHSVFTFAVQDHITQVVYNLVDNAVKFCPAGGTIGLKVHEGGNKIYVSVFNEGQTIPSQELPLLFDRFHKLDKSRSENREGWGLGLYIVKTLVCSHGEDISVSSEDDKTEFTFTLPLSN